MYTYFQGSFGTSTLKISSIKNDSFFVANTYYLIIFINAGLKDADYLIKDLKQALEKMERWFRCMVVDNDMG